MSEIETFELSIFINMKPEFKDYSTCTNKNILKFIYFPVSASPFSFTAKSFYSFYKDPAIPASVKNSNMPNFRSFFTKTP